MQNSKRHQQVEQIEIIERTVEESSRPVTSSEAFTPVSFVKKSTENFVSTDFSEDIKRRFNLPCEKDVERDASVFYSPSMGPQPSLFVSPPICQSTPERPISINQFGYDLHEVQTHAGTAQVIETHGAGKLSHEESMSGRTDFAGAGLSRLSSPGILKHPRHTLAKIEVNPCRSPSSDSSIQRKDSYRRMQELPHDVSYGQPSNLSAFSESKKLSGWTGKFFKLGKLKQQKQLIGEDSLDRLKGSFTELSRQMRESAMTRPRLVSIFIFIFLIVLLLIFWFIFSALFLPKSTYSFWLYPPICEECQRRTGSSNRSPSKLYVHLHSPAQLHFELVGNPPFKSNSFTAVDFDTGYVAVADHSLTDGAGRHIICFIMQLDTSSLPSMSSVNNALKKTFQEVHAQFGWQEYWQFTVEQVDRSFVEGKFKDPIEDCQNVQWYLLKHTLYTNDESCSYCYDFCLPDYAVLRRQKYEDEVSIEIRRLNCFRLYVPEWSKYEFKTDATGGHFAYPINQPQNTQRVENDNWVNSKYASQQQSGTTAKLL
uniref:Uncharacterized protein n=1 Tax=Meloidogyne enterolobii TaxID=390850 RepID=A0A6V7XI89_MELEN|nr:unnamed protein product [Meloidogyne enterolobii]